MAKIGTKAWIAALADLLRLIPEDKQEHGAYALETLISGDPVPPVLHVRPSRERDPDDDEEDEEDGEENSDARAEAVAERYERRLRESEAECEKAKKLAAELGKFNGELTSEVSKLNGIIAHREQQLKAVNTEEFERLKKLEVTSPPPSHLRGLARVHSAQYTEIKKKFDLSREEVLKLQADLRALRAWNPQATLAAPPTADVPLPDAKPGSLIGALNGMIRDGIPHAAIAHSPAEVREVAINLRDLMGERAKNIAEAKVHRRVFERLRQWIEATSGFVVVVSSEENGTFAFANEADGGESGPANKATVYADLDAAKKRRDAFREHYAKSNGWCDYRAEIIDLKTVAIIP